MLELTVSAAPQAVEPVEREIAVKAASSAVRSRLGRCSFMSGGGYGGWRRSGGEVQERRRSGRVRQCLATMLPKCYARGIARSLLDVQKKNHKILKNMAIR